MEAAKERGWSAVALTPGDDMVLKSSYYSSAQLGRLRSLAERLKKKEAVLLREVIDALLRKQERAESAGMELPETTQRELAELAARYGAPLVVDAPIADD